MQVMDMLDVSDEKSYNAGIEAARAVAEVQAASWEDRKRLAGTSNDIAILRALSELNDPDIDRFLLKNEHTSPRTLRIIAEHKCKELTSAQTDEYKATKEELAVLDIMKHPNVDSELLKTLSIQQSWIIRYAVTMKVGTPMEVLRQLAKDRNLAVRAMASSRLDIPADDCFKPLVGCSQLNKKFETLVTRMSSCIGLADEISVDIGFDEKNKEYEYRPSDEFSRDCAKAFGELRTRVAAKYVSTARREHFPNVDVSDHDFSAMMATFGDMHFDAHLIAAKLKEIIDQRTNISMIELLDKAKHLLPNVTRKEDNPSWHIANRPEDILKGSRLKLRAFVRDSPDIDYASIDYDVVEQIAALDKISKVVLAGVDPATVTSNIPTLLSGRRTPGAVFCKIWVGEPRGILAIRMFRNDRFDAQYTNAERARKVAEVLVSPTEAFASRSP